MRSADGGPVDEADAIGKKRAIAASPESKASSKRSRVSRACDQCRASREKCDGSQPVCQTCVAQRRDCTYHEQPKKRGIQPNYIRTLELTLAWLFRNFSQSESLLASKLPVDSDATHRIVAGRDGSAAEELHHVWRNSIVCRQIDQILSGSAVERLDQETSTQTEGPRHDTSTQPRLEVHTEVPGYPHQAFQIDPHLESQSVSASAFRLALPSNAWTLLEYYFAFTHAWLPITDKQELLKLMYNFPVDGVAPGELENASYSELWSVMALAATQMRLAGYEVDSGSLHEIASSSIPSEHDRFELSHIKALLLLGLLDVTTEKYLAAWLLVGSAVRLISAMTATHGYLAPDTAFRSLIGRAGKSASSVATLKLVTLAAFVLETSLAASLGATPHLRPDQMSSIGLLHEEGLEEWSPWHDPLSQASSTKSPARSFSTLNKIIIIAIDAFQHDSNLESIGSAASQRIARQQDGDLTMRSGDSRRITSVVSALVQNAARPDRLQPMHVVAQAGALAPAGAGHRITTNTHESPAQAHAKETNQLQQNVGYMSIPTNGSADTAPSNTSPAIANYDLMSNSLDAWPSSVPQNSYGANLDITDGTTSNNGADIFEELAMLERTDSSSHPQFMQNLGFAPDVDLAEFFGDDYQPSDPLLAYMHPSINSTGAGASKSNTGTDFG